LRLREPRKGHVRRAVGEPALLPVGTEDAARAALGLGLRGRVAGTMEAEAAPRLASDRVQARPRTLEIPADRPAGAGLDRDRRRAARLRRLPGHDRDIADRDLAFDEFAGSAQEARHVGE